MTRTSITAPGLSGVLRMTWARDDLAHVLQHADVDEPSGTWTGLACHDHELALGSDVDNATLRRLALDGKVADLLWEVPEELAAEHDRAFESAMQAYHAGNSESAEQQWQHLQAIWSRAWAANYAVLELLQKAGITTFSPVKPQRWVVASFEHHCGPHGLPQPHVHNIVITQLTTGFEPIRCGGIRYAQWSMRRLWRGKASSGLCMHAMQANPRPGRNPSRCL